MLSETGASAKQDKQKQTQIDQLKRQVETLVKNARKRQWTLTLSHMKFLFSLFALVIAVHCSFAQTNTFPSSGNVGIGTTNPSETLDIAGNIRTDRIRSGSAIFSANSRTSFNSFNTGNDPVVTVGWIAADLGGNDNASDRVVIGTGYGGKAIIGVHNYNLTAWGGPLLIAPSGGNVGIGTTNPSYKLDIAGTSNATGQSWFSYGNTNMSGYSWTNSALTTNSIEIVNNNGTVNNLAPTLAFHRYGSGGPQFRLAADGSCVLYLESAGANSARNPAPYGGGPNSYFTRLHIDGALTTTGNVGIGTTDTKGYTFAVNGSAIATSMTVKLNSTWPDYVFDTDYKLTELNELKAYVEKHHHLPEIPSADQMTKNGVNLGDMNIKLLKKVEELTLYLIEKDKQLAEQQQINNEQRKKNEQEDARIAALEKALIKLNANK
jgi:hypothetical protein